MRSRKGTGGTRTNYSSGCGRRAVEGPASHYRAVPYRAAALELTIRAGVCGMDARRRAWLAPGGFRAPLSEPGVHLSLCTGLSVDLSEVWGFHPAKFEVVHFQAGELVGHDSTLSPLDAAAAWRTPGVPFCVDSS